MYSGFQPGKSTMGLGTSTSGGTTNAGTKNLSTYQPRNPNYNSSGGNEAAAKAQVLRQQTLDKVQAQRLLRAKEVHSKVKTEVKPTPKAKRKSQ